MKKITLIMSIAIALISCGKRDVSDLKLHSDKLDDVKEKFGKADSIAKIAFFGNTAELWYYKKDSIALVFANDILAEIRTPETERAVYKKIEDESKAKMDSLFKVASEELQNSK